jgi:DNA-binding transcriptional ArsR family regulator
MYCMSSQDQASPLPDAQEKLEELESVLAALAHASRLHILLVVLFHGGTISAGEIAGRFRHSWPTISRHLRVLEQSGLLQVVKVGRSRVYRVNDQRLQVVRDWLRWFDQPPQGDAVPAAATRPEIVLRDIALAYPAAQEVLLDGERVIKVQRRNFLILAADRSGFQMTARLPTSRAAALQHPFVRPKQYRLGKNDWITVSFGPGDELPLELLWEWIDESYRAAAPTKLLAGLPSPPPVPQGAAGNKAK